jgi:hypothetical protein
MTPAQKHLHGWLCLNSDRTIHDLWGDLIILHRTLPEAYKHLPPSKTLLGAGLLELESLGLAAMHPDGRWKFKAEKAKPTERTLFV